MVAKKRLFPILVAVLTALAMLWMATVTAYAVEADTTPPDIDATTVRATYPEGKDAATAGDTVTVSVAVSDESGVRQLQFVYRPEGIEGSSLDRFFYAAYDAESDAYVSAIEVTEDTVSGQWRLWRIWATDTKGNRIDLWDPRAKASPQADLSAGDFAVYGTNADVTPPDIDATTVRATYPEGKDAATAGDTVTVSVAASDESGVRQLQFVYRPEGSAQDRFFYPTYDAESDAYVAAIAITEDTVSGLWRLWRIWATDTKGNRIDLWDPRANAAPQADLSGGDFIVTENCKITFNTNGGSEVAPQYVLPGEKATRPDPKPTKDGFSFGGWYQDEALTRYFSFSDPINEDITLYAKWDVIIGYNSYDATKGVASQGGRFSITEDSYEDDPTYGWMFFMMEPGQERVLTAYPDKGYVFKGWYEGKAEDIYQDGQLYSQTIVPQDLDDPSTLISADAVFPVTIERNRCFCAVFEEHADHQWEDMVQKATPEANGRVYQQCSVCGAEETVAPLLRVSRISLAETSFAYTGKAIEPKVTVGNASEELSPAVYDVTYANNTGVGTATVTVTLKGQWYEGSKTLTFTITKAANPLSVKGKKVTVKFAKLQGKSQSLAVGKLVKFTKQVGDKKSYKLSSAKKGKKSFKKYFKVSKTTGKLTVKKGLPKGTYKVQVKVKAKGSGSYNASAWKTVTITIKVK